VSIILDLKISEGKYSFKVPMFSACTMNRISCKQHSSRSSYFVKYYKEQ